MEVVVAIGTLPCGNRTVLLSIGNQSTNYKRTVEYIGGTPMYLECAQALLSICPCWFRSRQSCIERTDAGLNEYDTWSICFTDLVTITAVINWMKTWFLQMQ